MLLLTANLEEQFALSAKLEAEIRQNLRGLGQCVATMVGAQLFNQRAENEIKAIYGAVTTGTTWKFLKLEGKTVFIDSSEYYIKEVDNILGILLQPVKAYLTTGIA